MRHENDAWQGSAIGRLRISDVRFTASPFDEQKESGLLGWVSCVVNGRLHLDRVALRRTRSGRLALSFPSRRDGRGRKHFIVRPLDDVARREIEAQVFAALGIREDAP